MKSFKHYRNPGRKFIIRNTFETSAYQKIEEA